MTNVMNFRKLMMTDRDCGLMREMLQRAKEQGGISEKTLAVLEKEIDESMVFPPDQIPPYVVTMHTTVRVKDLKTRTASEFTLVYPDEEDIPAGKFSVLSDLGMGILGFAVGDTFEWEFPDGAHELRIDMITYQPEATHNYEA
jgi:regulator of nucleoside diphosphate kinase